MINVLSEPLASSGYYDKQTGQYHEVKEPPMASEKVVEILAIVYKNTPDDGETDASLLKNLKGDTSRKRKAEDSDVNDGEDPTPGQ